MLSFGLQVELVDAFSRGREFHSETKLYGEYRDIVVDLPELVLPNRYPVTSLIKLIKLANQTNRAVFDLQILKCSSPQTVAKKTCMQLS